MTETRKAITEFELVDHGIDHEQYFQGCWVAFTQFTNVATGIGNNPAEAIDDALEMLASSGEWDVDGLDARINEQEGFGCSPPKLPRVLKRHGDEAHYYISIRVR